MAVYVAILIIHKACSVDQISWLIQVCVLGRLHHRNLVNLVGYCVDKGQHMLIYEFMSNGSLANLLYGKLEPCLISISRFVIFVPFVCWKRCALHGKRVEVIKFVRPIDIFLSMVS